MMPRICLWLSAFVGPCVVCSAQEYNPLETVQPGQVRTLELIVNDSRRSRELPIRVYLPPADAGVVGETAEKSPVVLFSHGLGGSRQGSAFLGKHWAARGYIAAFLQHPGSDDSVWKDVGVAQRMAALQQAASTENYLLRVQDVSAVLDQLEKWNAEPTHVLHDCLDLERVGLSGHSFGAQTTQAVAGQAAALGGARADRRVKAAVIMSPGVPALGSAERAFGRVSLPWLLMTGTNDTSPKHLLTGWCWQSYQRRLCSRESPTQPTRS